MAKSYPLIVVFDLDGTLIGPSNFVTSTWMLVHQVDVVNIDDNLRRCKELVVGSLRSKLARPHIAEFIKALNNKFQYVELFIYTSAGAEWTAFAIGCVEEAFGVSFNRPLFTREQHTLYGIKHLTNIIPDIQETLKDKYGFLPSSVIHDTIIVFEDHPEVYTDARDFMRIYKCPSYGNFDHIDILGVFPEYVVVIV